MVVCVTNELYSEREDPKITKVDYRSKFLIQCCRYFIRLVGWSDGVLSPGSDVDFKVNVGKRGLEMTHDGMTTGRITFEPWTLGTL
jgi:hypothetical protein